MNSADLNQRLSQITTLWTLVSDAHQGAPQDQMAAREVLLARYGEAVQRYLRKALGDREAVDEVYQEFALRFVGGKFHHADPGRGKFRQYLKTVLYHLIVDHRQQKRMGPLDEGAEELAREPPELSDIDGQLRESWRDHLLARTWQLLAGTEAETGQPVHTVLRLRVDQPKLRSPELAAELGTKLGKSFTSAGARQALRRARDKFADLLLQEVAHSLNNPTVKQLEEELQELDLLRYFRPRLKQRISED